jgi:Domain of unknown function (DUF4279)
MAVTDVSASLRLSGNTRRDTAAAVSAALGIEPSSSHEFGEPHPSKSLVARGKVTVGSLWRYSEPRTISSEEDPHGIESLVRLAARFEPHAATLAALKANYDIEVLMFGSSDSGQGGLLIGPETMRRLGMLSASFIQTIWLSDHYSAKEIADWDDLRDAP